MTTLFMRPYHMPQPETKEVYLAELLTMLKTYPLRKENAGHNGTFYHFNNSWVTGGDYRNEQGEEVYRCQNLPPDIFMCHGNFYNYSYAFCVYSDDPQVIKAISAAVDENMARPDYQEQTPYNWPPSHEVIWNDKIITDWAQSLKQCGKGTTYVYFD